MSNNNFIQCLIIIIFDLWIDLYNNNCLIIILVSFIHDKLAIKLIKVQIRTG